MKKKQRISPSKLFVLSFLISAIVLTVLFGLYHRFLLSGEQQADLQVTGVTVPTYSAKDNMSFLVIYDRDLSGEDLFAAVVCLDAVHQTILVSELDLRIEVFSNGQRNALSEKYRLRGTKGLKTGVESLLQRQFDAVIRCDQNGLWETVNAFSGVLLQENDLQEVREAATVNAYHFAELFAQREHREMLFFRLVERCLTDIPSKEKTKQIMFCHCDTDLSAYQALEHQNAVEYLVQNKQFTLLSMQTQPVDQNGKTLYLPDADTVSLLQQSMA